VSVSAGAYVFHRHLRVIKQLNRDMIIWTGEYEENKEKDVQTWLEAPESIIHEKGIQLRVVSAKFTDDSTMFSFMRHHIIRVMC
jgi:hypothetical protein